MSEYREADDKSDSQQQIAIDLRADPREMRTPEIAFQRGVVELQARKTALELACVSRSGRREAASLEGVYRLPANQFVSCCLRRSRASLMKRRHTS